jgi:hypothetical protein
MVSTNGAGNGRGLIAALMDEFELFSNKPGTTLRMIRAAVSP